MRERSKERKKKKEKLFLLLLSFLLACFSFRPAGEKKRMRERE
jgi:hypothetical protein